MKTKKNKSKDTPIYTIALTILTLAVISAIIILIYLNKPSNYQIENENIAISTILSVTDNVINKIYNIVVILTLYITVIIATFSLFQYSRNKDYEKLKEDVEIRLENEISNLKNENELIKNEFVSQSKESEKITNNLILKLKIELLEIKAANELKENTFYNSQNAIKYYDEISEIIDKDPDIIDNEKKSNIYFQLGYHSFAIDKIKSKVAYLKALEYSNNNYLNNSIYHNLAMIESDRKEYELAIDYYKKSIEMNKFNYDSYIQLIVLYDKQQNERIALEYLRDYFNLNDVDSKQRLGILISIITSTSIKSELIKHIG